MSDRPFRSHIPAQPFKVKNIATATWDNMAGGVSEETGEIVIVLGFVVAGVPFPLALSLKDAQSLARTLPHTITQTQNIVHKENN
jgi:hypothetical protein